MAFGRGNAVSIAFEGKDEVSPVVRGIKNTMDQFKRDAKQGFGIAAGFNVATKAMNLGMDALRGVANFTGEAIDKASQMEEAQSKVAAVFGYASDEIEDWASTTTQAFGISELAANRAAGNFGNLFTAFGVTKDAAADMSIVLVELAADLASFNDTSIEDAMQAIQSGLAGEMEPMKRYGSILTVARIEEEALAQGIWDRSEKMTQAQKIEATYSLIMKDTANAQGDVARTSESLANKQRKLDAQMEDFQTNLGTGLLPIMSSVVGIFSDFANTLVGLTSDDDATAGLPALNRLFNETAIAAGAAADAVNGDWALSGTPIDSIVDGLWSLTRLVDDAPLIGQRWVSEAEAIEEALTPLRHQLGWSEDQLKDFAWAAAQAGLGLDEIVAAARHDADLQSFLRQDDWSEFVNGSNIKPKVKGWAEQVTKDIRVAIFESTDDFDVNDVLMSAIGQATQTGMDWSSGLFGSVSGRISGKNAKPRGKGSLYRTIKDQLELEKNNVRDLLNDPKLLRDIQTLYEEHKAFLERKLTRAQGGGNTLAALYIGENLSAADTNLDGIAAAAVAGATQFGTSWNTAFDAAIEPYLGDLFRGELELRTITATVAVQVTGDRGLLEWLISNGVTPGAMPPYPGGADGKISTPYPKAMGGDVAPSQTYLIGENGPELLRLGGRGGSIIPNHNLGGNGEVAVYLDGRLVGRLLDERLGRSFGGQRGTY